MYTCIGYENGSQVTYTSEIPSEVIFRAGLSDIIILDNWRITWTQLAPKALFHAARIELFHYSYMMPFEMNEDVLIFLRRGKFNNDVKSIIMKMHDKTVFEKMLYHAFLALYSRSPWHALATFNVKKRKNSAFDLHLRACKFYLENNHFELDHYDLIDIYEELNGNPIQDYWMRVVLSDHSDSKELETEGFRLRPRLG